MKNNISSNSIEMNCNSFLNNELKKTGNIVCPFCDFQLTYKKKTLKYDCCNNPNIINNNGMLVCQSCGVVQGYNFVEEYIDFYKNRQKLKRKSVYHREYHINNALLNIKEKYNIEISFSLKNKIDRVFVEIRKILNEVNCERKRMIGINFIIRKVLIMMDLPFEDIPISKSKKTLVSYEKYWTSIMTLIGDYIKRIIQ